MTRAASSCNGETAGTSAGFIAGKSHFLRFKCNKSGVLGSFLPLWLCKGFVFYTGYLTWPLTRWKNAGTRWWSQRARNTSIDGTHHYISHKTSNAYPFEEPQTGVKNSVNDPMTFNNYRLVTLLKFNQKSKVKRLGA